MTDNKFPYKEGDDYYCIEQNLVIRSCWDDISESIHTSDKIYYSTKEEAVLAHYKANHNKDELALMLPAHEVFNIK